MGVMLDCNDLTIALISPLRVVLTKYSSFQPLGKHYIETRQLSVYLIVLMLLHKMSSQDFPPPPYLHTANTGGVINLGMRLTVLYIGKVFMHHLVLQK